MRREERGVREPKWPVSKPETAETAAAAKEKEGKCGRRGEAREKRKCGGAPAAAARLNASAIMFELEQRVLDSTPNLNEITQSFWREGGGTVMVGCKFLIY